MKLILLLATTTLLHAQTIIGPVISPITIRPVLLRPDLTVKLSQPIKPHAKPVELTADFTPISQINLDTSKITYKVTLIDLYGNEIPSYELPLSTYSWKRTLHWALFDLIGIRKIRVTVDPDNLINESNENNNTQEISYDLSKEWEVDLVPEIISSEWVPKEDSRPGALRSDFFFSYQIKNIMKGKQNRFIKSRYVYYGCDGRILYKSPLDNFNTYPSAYSIHQKNKQLFMASPERVKQVCKVEIQVNPDGVLNSNFTPMHEFNYSNNNAQVVVRTSTPYDNYFDLTAHLYGAKLITIANKEIISFNLSTLPEWIPYDITYDKSKICFSLQKVRNNYHEYIRENLCLRNNSSWSYHFDIPKEELDGFEYIKVVVDPNNLITEQREAQDLNETNNIKIIEIPTN